MKRTIKFKGKRKDTGEWVYGSLLTLPTRVEISDYGAINYEVDSTTVCQFTGLFDSEGKEIYEGDIVYVPETEFNGELKGVVEWRDDSYVIKSLRSDWSSSLMWVLKRDHALKHLVRKPKVIGSIYD